MSLITFGGQQVTHGGQVVLAPFDALKIPNIKILVSAKRQSIQANNTVNSTIKNWTGLGDGTGNNLYQTNVIGSNPAIKLNTNVIATFPSSLVAGSTQLSQFVHLKKSQTTFTWGFILYDGANDTKFVIFTEVDNGNVATGTTSGAGLVQYKYVTGEEITIGLTWNVITGEVRSYVNGNLLSVYFTTILGSYSPQFISIGLAGSPMTDQFINWILATSIISDVEMMQLHTKATQTGMI